MACDRDSSKAGWGRVALGGGGTLVLLPPNQDNTDNKQEQCKKPSSGGEFIAPFEDPTLKALRQEVRLLQGLNLSSKVFSYRFGRVSMDRTSQAPGTRNIRPWEPVTSGHTFPGDPWAGCGRVRWSLDGFCCPQGVGLGFHGGSEPPAPGSAQHTHGLSVARKSWGPAGQASGPLRVRAASREDTAFHFLPG